MLSNHDVSSPIIGTAILSFKDKASVGSPRIIGHAPVCTGDRIRLLPALTTRQYTGTKKANV
jgi:hypothetical protein